MYQLHIIFSWREERGIGNTANKKQTKMFDVANRDRTSYSRLQFPILQFFGWDNKTEHQVTLTSI